MPSRLVLLAHAATPATRLARFPISSDCLEPGAVEEVRRAGQRWAKAVRILHGPGLAARETALAVSSASVAPVEDADLRDLDCGSWAGRSLHDIGPEAARWIAEPRYDGHGGESIAALCRRAGQWLEGRVAISGLTLGITHAAFVRAALLATLDAPPSGFWRIDVAPLCALELHSDGRRWTVRALTPPERRKVSASVR